MKMQKKLKTFALLFLFLLVSGLAFSEDCDTVDAYQYKPSGDCETTSRKCCDTGWSAWSTTGSYQCPPPRPSNPCAAATKASCRIDEILLDCDVSCTCDLTTKTYTQCTVTPTCAEGYLAVATTVTSRGGTTSNGQQAPVGWPPVPSGVVCKECGGKAKPSCSIPNGTCTWKTCTCNTSTTSWNCSGKNVTCDSGATQVGECCQVAGGPPCATTTQGGVWKLKANNFSCNSSAGSLSQCAACTSKIKGAQCVVGTRTTTGTITDNFSCQMYVCEYYGD